MKKLCLILSLILMMTSLMPIFSSAQEVVSGGYIVLADKNDARLIAAGDTLAKYMKQITGKDFPVAEDGEGLKFTLGYSADIPDNGYVIETKENEVAITGNGTRGVIHGVYGFLEKYCDCHWYTSTLCSIPENRNLTIPAGEKTEYKPFFEYTDTDWTSPRDTEYSLANGLNGNTYRQIPSELGGTVDYLSGKNAAGKDASGFAHTLGSLFCSKEAYFESHPEYFALHDGIRQSEQLCLTNEDVYNLVLAEVMTILEEKHNPDASLQIISLTQGDSGENAKMCQCPDCKAIDDENGSHSGTMITFVNRIAKAVKDAGYDNVAIDTFAYRYTRKAPSKVVPAENVIVRLCTIECCFAHSLDDTTCSANRELMADLEDWSEICKRIYVWDYTTNYAHTLGIFPDFGVLQKNMQIFYEHNVVGVYEEGNYYMAQCDGEFGELRAYLLSKLMQNPYLNYNQTMDGFLKAYYGKGWENIRQFIDLTTNKAAKDNAHLKIYHTMGQTLAFSEEDIAEADTLWENAKNAAETEEQLNNIKRSEISWRYWKAFNCYNKEANDQLIADIKAMGITMVCEGDTRGPDGLVFEDVKATTLGNNFLFPISIMFYGVSAVMGLAAAILAVVKKPRKYVYIALPVLIGVFFELFGWHRRAYLYGTDIFGYVLTFVLIVALFAFAGAIMTRGKKNRIISAIVCPAIWLVSYAVIVFIINNLIYTGSAAAACIGAQYVVTGIEAFVILIITLRNLIKDKSKNS
ncbi:MAG: DUF4838 domain-containing protein [Clostridia bacterium]|nr:DUF4838 domain-containing protein [Clostridia bacterium]